MMKFIAKLIPTKPTPCGANWIPVTPKNGTDFSLEEVQKMVGGNVELIPMPGKLGAILLINEDGKALDLPFNKYATAIFREHSGNDDTIVGNALLAHVSQFK